MNDHDGTIAICPRCRGTIEIGEKVYVVGKHDVMATGELSLIENVEKICERCYPLMEVRWPDSVEHDHGTGRKALSIIMAKDAPATG